MNQQTEGINKNIASKGCKYLCHLKIAELETKVSFPVEKLNIDYADHKKYGWLKNECDVIKPNEIMADFILDMGGGSPYPRQLGRITKDGTVHFWGGKQTRNIKYWLVEYKTTNGYHWILCDNLGNELYDSWKAGYTRKYINSINLVG